MIDDYMIEMTLLLSSFTKFMNNSFKVTNLAPKPGLSALHHGISQRSDNICLGFSHSNCVVNMICVNNSFELINLASKPLLNASKYGVTLKSNNACH